MANNSEESETEKIVDEFIKRLTNYIEALSQKRFYERFASLLGLKGNERIKKEIKMAEQRVQETRDLLKEVLKKIIERS